MISGHYRPVETADQRKLFTSGDYCSKETTYKWSLLISGDSYQWKLLTSGYC